MILGVDPGASGALALVHKHSLLWVDDLPVDRRQTSKGRGYTVVDAKRLRDAVEHCQALAGGLLRTAVVERVSSAPGMGVASAFRFGYGAGIVEAVLTLQGLEVVWAAPALWKPQLRLQGLDKGLSLTRAVEAFGADDRLRRRRDEGRAEAALLALWGQLRGHGVEMV